MSNPVFPPYTPPVGAFSWRDDSDALSPTFWNGPVGQRVRYSMALPYDKLQSLIADGIYARCPVTAPTDAYPWMCADRLVTTGPNETQDHLIARLTRWLIAARYFGTCEGIMLAILGYLSPVVPQIACVNNPGVLIRPTGTWYTYAAGTDPWPEGQGAPTPPTIQFALFGTPWNWDNTSPPFVGGTQGAGWWRTWVILNSDPAGSVHIWPVPDMVLGSFNLGDGTLLNFGTQSPTSVQSTGWLNDVQTLRTLTSLWRGAHTTVPCVIVTYNEALFQYAASSGDMPDGTYGYWYLVGSQTGQSTRDYIVLAFTIGPGPAFFDYPSCYRGTSSPVVSPVSFAFPAVYGSGRSLSPVSYIDGVTS